MKARHWFALGSVVVIAVVLFRSGARAPGKGGERLTGLAGSSPRVTAALRETEGGEISDDAAVRRSILSDWSALREWLRTEPSAAEIALRLKELRERWVTLDPHVLAAVLGELLAGGEDAPTGLAFEVGPHGFLNGWNSLRVFLLDVLAAADPETAASTARVILDRTASAEEFAVALRSLTHPGPGRAGEDELQARLKKLLGRSDWVGAAGFAEALDLPRVIGSATAFRELAVWRGNDRLRDMSLHEFAAEHPAAMIEALSGEENVLPFSTRASLMARAQVDDPAQRDAVDAYFRQSGISSEEASAFLRLFPLKSATTGNRLYGASPAPYGKEQIASGDRAALALADQWLQDSTLVVPRSEVVALRNRLAIWVEQADSP